MIISRIVKWMNEADFAIWRLYIFCFLFAGLIVGIIYGVLSPLWVSIPVILVMSEVIFYLDKGRPNEDEDAFTFTLWRKLEAIIDSLIIVVYAMGIVILSEKIDFYAILESNFPAIMQAIYWIGSVVLVVLGIAVWVWLNSLRYRKKDSKKPKLSHKR